MHLNCIFWLHEIGRVTHAGEPTDLTVLQRPGRTVGSTHGSSAGSYGRAAEENPAQGQDSLLF